MRNVLRSFNSSLLLAARAGVVMSMVVAAPGAAWALSWQVVQCSSGTECPKVGTPTGACTCGFYTDSPGRLVGNGETVFAFVESNADDGVVDETASWRAALPAADYSGYTQISARAAANDPSYLLYQNTAGNAFPGCLEVDPDVLAVLQWVGNPPGPNDDDSIFR